MSDAAALVEAVAQSTGGWIAQHVSVPAVIGGLVGALLGPFFVFWVDQRRLRGEVAVRVVEWLQETYRYLEMRLGQLRFLHTGRDDLVRPDDVTHANHQLRLRMLEDALRARVSVAFGEGRELRLLETFQSMLRTLVEKKMWQLRDAEAWKTFDTESKPFIKKMNDVREQLEKLMLRRARLPWLLRRF
jgi:hypothetical protein